tara:strand:- start:851 stop:1042 length:192 start_codon:yes stop_codon:yes gene_type:complete
MVYLLKHIDGINAYIDGHKSQREGVEGRIIDTIVYLFLLWGYITAQEDTDWVSDITPPSEFRN